MDKFKQLLKDTWTFINHRWFKWPLLIGLALIGLSIAGFLFIIFGGRLVVDETALILPATTQVVTEEGDYAGRLYQENRQLVRLRDVPEHVQEAFIAIEDQRFYSHAGVDFRGVVRAVYRDIIAFDKVEGASTITQQLAKNLFLSNDKTWMRKTKEAMAAIYLEKEFSKDDILELYLNAIYFGHGVYGIEAASQKYFSKSIEDVTLTEGALLAGMVKAPNGYSPIEHPDKALNRRNHVLQAMEEMEIISTEQRLQEQGKTLELNVQETDVYPWIDSYVDLVMKEAAEEYTISSNELRRGGYRIVVSMDSDIQQIAYEQFENETHFPGNTEDAEGAFVMIDHVTGQI